MADTDEPTVLTRAQRDLHVLGVLREGGTPDSLMEPPALVWLFGITGALAAVLFIIAEIANYQEIRRNWGHYRCQPSVAPFAKFYGYDLEETLNFCIGQAVKEHAPGVITPIYEGVERVMGVVDGVYAKAEAVEGGIKGLLSGFESFVMNFVNSMRLIGTRIRMSVVRIKDIFARVYGIFIAFAYAAISAITFGENLVCNPLVTFIGTIAGVDICCFAPDTLVEFADGSWHEIRDVPIGVRLAGPGEPLVSSRYVFDSSGAALFVLDGVVVSGNHYVRGGSDGAAMVRVEEHPAARPFGHGDAPRPDRLICLATTTNRIPIVSNSSNGRLLEFADYEEAEDPTTVAAAQAAAERALGAVRPGTTVPDYSLGLEPGTWVLMAADGQAKQLADVRIGDQLLGGGRVIGVIQELCHTLVRTPGGALMAAAQLVRAPDGRWVRAANLWPWSLRQSFPILLSHIMLDNAPHGAFFVQDGTQRVLELRDYAEAVCMETQAPYDAVMAKS
jgi:hypothetical protein